MNAAIRFEKMRFLIAEMQIVFELTKHAPDSFITRTFALHVVIRAENFIKYARTIRRSLNIPTSSDCHTDDVMIAGGLPKRHVNHLFDREGIARSEMGGS